MADPPDPLHFHVYNHLERPCNFAECVEHGLCGGYTLREHTIPSHGPKKPHTNPTQKTSFHGIAPSTYLAYPSGRRSPQHHARLNLLRTGATNNAKPLINGERTIRATPSDTTTAVKLESLSLGQAREESDAVPEGRGTSVSRKRPASSDLSTLDAKADQSRAFGRAIAIRTSVASKYIKRPTADNAARPLQPSEGSMNADTEQISKPTSEQPHTPGLSSENSKDHGSTPFLCLASSKSIEQSFLGAAGSRSMRQAKPISQDQLAAEVKGIYAALVMVEAKCIKLDNAHMSGSGKPPNLSYEQWQALIALHRTLLYEHHDFLSASQHPSTSSSLRRLVSKYSMPARMWKHGIHSFLEVLRRRLPDSLDYMLQFIYMAYQMVALLYETIPSFQDTWIECLGDLARYRMAIEELDMRDRETWGVVAREWYSKSSNRNPDVGRLYHHLGILARPNAVQQVYFYCRSLTCTQPFESAMESLSSLLSPLASVESGRPVIPYVDETDSMFLYLHAKMLSARSQNRGANFSMVLSAYHSRLVAQIQRQALKWKDHGVFIAVTNISACFGYGFFDSHLEKAYRTSSQDFITPKVDSTLDEPLHLLTNTFAIVLSREKDFNVLPHVHTILAFLWSIYNLAAEEAALIGKILRSIPWGKIADFLNSFIKAEPIEDRIADAGRQGSFLQGVSNAVKPLPEDYLLRGLVWCKDYFVSGWFDEKHDEESRLLELPSTNKVRIERVLRLSICLSQKGNFITFDHSRKEFLKLSHQALKSCVGTVSATRSDRHTQPIRAASRDVDDLNKSATTSQNEFRETAPVLAGWHATI